MQRPRYFVVEQSAIRAYVICYEKPFQNALRWSARWVLCRRHENVVELIAQGGDEFWFMRADEAANHALRAIIARVRESSST
jgi:hypothetical protein